MGSRAVRALGWLQVFRRERFDRALRGPLGPPARRAAIGTYSRLAASQLVGSSSLCLTMKPAGRDPRKAAATSECTLRTLDRPARARFTTGNRTARGWRAFSRPVRQLRTRPRLLTS